MDGGGREAGHFRTTRGIHLREAPGKAQVGGQCIVAEPPITLALLPVKSAAAEYRWG